MAIMGADCRRSVGSRTYFGSSPIPRNVPFPEPCDASRTWEARDFGTTSGERGSPPTIAIRPALGLFWMSLSPIFHQLECHSTEVPGSVRVSRHDRPASSLDTVVLSPSRSRFTWRVVPRFGDIPWVGSATPSGHMTRSDRVFRIIATIFAVARQGFEP